MKSLERLEKLLDERDAMVARARRRASARQAMTKERPILFSAPMVLAILEGKKCQTRRVVRPDSFAGKWLADVEDDFAGACAFVADPGNCPPFVVGDRLWVKETFYCDDGRYPKAPIEEMRKLVEYRATHVCQSWEAGCPCHDENGRSSWCSPLFMPRWASRLTLEVTDVRVERLQNISEADAQAEGVPIDIPADLCVDKRAEFRELWDRINGKNCPWASNCWVWVVSFRRVEADPVAAYAEHLAGVEP